MKFKIIAVIAAVAVFGSILCSCSKPNNSSNGNNLVPGAVRSVNIRL